MVDFTVDELVTSQFFLISKGFPQGRGISRRKRNVSDTANDCLLHTVFRINICLTIANRLHLNRCRHRGSRQEYTTISTYQNVIEITFAPAQ